MDVKFKAALPKDEEANGLAGSDWNRQLLTDVETEHVAIVTFKTADMNGLPGYQRAIAGFVRFEPVTDEAQAEVLRQKLAAISAERLGLTQLPINDNVSVLDFDAPSEGGDAA
jgi:hypothetical protein